MKMKKPTRVWKLIFFGFSILIVVIVLAGGILYFINWHEIYSIRRKINIARESIDKSLIPVLESLNEDDFQEIIEVPQLGFRFRMFPGTKDKGDFFRWKFPRKLDLTYVPENYKKQIESGERGYFLSAGDLVFKSSIQQTPKFHAGVPAVTNDLSLWEDEVLQGEKTCADKKESIEYCAVVPIKTGQPLLMYLVLYSAGEYHRYYWITVFRVHEKKIYIELDKREEWNRLEDRETTKRYMPYLSKFLTYFAKTIEIVEPSTPPLRASDRLKQPLAVYSVLARFFKPEILEQKVTSSPPLKNNVFFAYDYTKNPLIIDVSSRSDKELDLPESLTIQGAVNTSKIKSIRVEYSIPKKEHYVLINTQEVKPFDALSKRWQYIASGTLQNRQAQYNKYTFIGLDENSKEIAREEVIVAFSWYPITTINNPQGTHTLIVWKEDNGLERCYGTCYLEDIKTGYLISTEKIRKSIVKTSPECLPNSFYFGNFADEVNLELSVSAAVEETDLFDFESPSSCAGLYNLETKTWILVSEES